MGNIEFLEWFADYYVKRWKDYGDPDFYRLCGTTRDEMLSYFTNDSFNLEKASLFKEQLTTNSKSGIYHSLHSDSLYIDGARDLSGRMTALDVITFSEGEKILDVGCNMGLLSHYLHDRGCSVTGLDMDPKIVTGAKMIANILRKDIEFIHHDLDTTKIERHYDTICLFSVIHHTKNFKEVTENLARHCNRLIIECGLKETGFKPINGKWASTTNWQFNSLHDLTPFIETVFNGFKFEQHYGIVDRDRYVLSFVKQSSAVLHKPEKSNSKDINDTNKTLPAVSF